jgi:hypothetical protein
MKKGARKKKLPARKNRSLPERAAAMLKRLNHVEGLSDQEKSVHALGLAATPQERWDIFERFIRSCGYWTPLKRKK